MKSELEIRMHLENVERMVRSVISHETEKRIQKIRPALLAQISMRSQIFILSWLLGENPDGDKYVTDIQENMVAIEARELGDE